MNCERFQEILLEYVDDALSPSEKSAAQAHLGECSACREFVRNEWLIRQVLSGRLTEAVETVTLDAPARRSMVDAVRKKFQDAQESKKTLSLPFWIRLAIPATALILISGIWLGRGFIHPRRPVVMTSTSPAPADVEIPVHLAYTTSHYTFHQEGAMVVDSLTSETRVADGALIAALAKK
ncbi:MAG TPA: zf-HC2 domain-containing protein [Verrucomicrobiae bacterium]|nr:zf-HC2 domain-containing protein [Verrucomicrobiae bacterium]